MIRRASRMVGNPGQMRISAAHNFTDEGNQSVEPSGLMSLQGAKALPKGSLCGTITAVRVAHGVPSSHAL